MATDAITFEAFCQAKDCDHPSVAILSSLEHGWVSLCPVHAVLMIAAEHAVREKP